MAAITQDVFGEFIDSDLKKHQVLRYTLKNKNGLVVQVMNYGATITSIKYADQHGAVDDVVLGYDTFPEYLAANNPYFGAVVGRVANRIGNAQFVLDGKEYKVTANRGAFQLHGGLRGFDKVVWYSEIQDGKVVMTYLSRDGEEGYPGDLLATATYSVTDDNQIRLDMTATTTKPTIVNMTNHSYFNLAGHSAGKTGLYQHRITVNADRYTLTDSNSIPSGVLAPVGGTLWDLRIARKFGDVVPLIPGGGYDQNLCVNLTSNCGLTFVARVLHPVTNRTLEVYSNQPGVQLYTSNFFPKNLPSNQQTEADLIGKNGTKYYEHGAFCLETQNYPDAVNHANFPNSVLRPGQTYKHSVAYKFGIYEEGENPSNKTAYQFTVEP